MEKKSKGNNAALHFFLYLVSFLSLTFLVFGFGGIMFQFINKFFPDPLMVAYQGLYSQDVVKFGIASIFVAGPVFFLITDYIVKQLRKGEISEESKVRKWLTYIVLFFAAATVIGDLIAILFSFLGGEITSRFVLKANVILGIALVVFGYFFWDMRKKGMLRKVYPLNALAGYVAGTVIVAVFVAAFFLIDKPSVAREKKSDQQMVNELQNADRSLRGYYDQSGVLPEKLEDLAKTNFSVYLSKGSAVEYQKTSDKTFELCAKFKRSNLDELEKNVVSIELPGNTWQHDAGKVCFERVVVKSTEEIPVEK